MIALPLLSLSPALATPPATLLQSMVEDEGARLAVACGPLEDAIAMIQQSPMVGVAAMGAPPEVQQVLPLLQPGALAQAGFDPTGSLTLQIGEEFLLAAPFTGSQEQAAALLESLSGAPPVEDGGGWRVGEESTRVRLSDGRLMIHEEAPQKTPPTQPRAALAAGLPDLPGCALIMGMPQSRADRPMPTTMAAFAGLGTGDLLVRLDLAKPPGLEAGAGAVRYGTSPDRPLLLLSAQVPPDALLQGPALNKALSERSIDLSSLDDLPVSLQPGMSVAVFGDLSAIQQAMSGAGQAPTPELAAVLPARMKSGGDLRPRLVARKARKELAARDLAVSREGGRGFSVKLDEESGPIHVRVQEDAFLIATTAERVEGMDDGAGGSWSTATHAALSEEWPVVATVELSGIPMLGGDLEYALGIRSQGTMLELSLAPGADASADSMTIIAALTALGRRMEALFSQVSEELDGAVEPVKAEPSTPE